ncbi:MAG TPA: transposase [Bdellovibrionales bacterium]|jgi:REP element-mobilizing transposase RayT|nr:transposase [Bdellovibrionales bacterium]
MPRRRYPLNPNRPYHVTVRCCNRDFFAIPVAQVWQFFTDQLYFVQRAYELRIHSYVLMDNHFHMIITSPNGNLAEAMQYYVRQLSWCIGDASSRINHVFGNRYHRTELVTDIYLAHAYKYLYRNPVEAGLCDRVEDYRYSSLRGLLGFERAPVMLAEDSRLFENLLGCIEWMNTEYKSGHRDDIRKALKKEQFKFAQRKRGRPSPLESMLS